MRSLFMGTALVGILAAQAAYANNERVERVLERRPDLSVFYQAMIDTGVNQELSDGVSYTIFAPTNEAMAHMLPPSYPCTYDSTCRAAVTDIVRNHIVVGEVGFNPSLRGTVFSIDREPLTLGEPFRGRLTVNGYRVLSQYQLAGGVIYRLDGVLANRREMAALSPAPYPYGAAGTETVTERVYYSPQGNPDGVSQTTYYYGEYAPAAR